MKPLSPGARRARAAWTAWWRAMRRYHRYSVVGLERLLDAGPALVVGYHGRPIAHDLVMLQDLCLQTTGRMPRAVFHAAGPRLPLVRDLVEGMEFLTDAEGVRRSLAEGVPVIVTPGGTREGCRPSTDRYRVEWGRRTGYLRLALERGVPIVPTAAAGVDDTYLALNDGYAWGKRLGAPEGLPVWLGIGPLGLWPLSPPFPVRITTAVGAPIRLPAVDPADRDALLALHAHVVGAVQRLLDTRADWARPS